MWAARAVKFGYRWVVGDGVKIRFWEDTWFGSSPLSVQFWGLYTVCNENLATIQQVWDGVNLKLTFRRNFNQKMIQQWLDLEKIASSLHLSNDCDSLVWTYTANGVYSTSSLYNIISFRGVIQVHIPAIWSLVVPPRVQIFLWLLSNNKLMTRDNLLKRNMHKPVDCVFCCELETINHLFFDCLVSSIIWEKVSLFFGIKLGSDFMSIARFWVTNKRHSALNAICAAVLWGIWKHRNALIFDNLTWICMKQIW